jgi:hypothetical protein
LGNSLNAQRILKSFNRRYLRKGFIKNKQFNIAIIDLSEFKSEGDYIQSVKGKNSADYFSRRCEKMGYTFESFDPNDEIEQIYNINSSSQERQGKSMAASYLEKVLTWPNESGNTWYGIFDPEGILVAYLWTIELNEMTLLNRILGHQEHLKNNIMYLLLTKYITNAIVDRKAKYVMYDTFGKFQNGLVMYKKRIGFKPYTVNFMK